MQLEPASDEAPPVDLMLVDDRTWEMLSAGAEQRELFGHSVALPRAEHLVALKLHAARAAARSKPETDWEDIRELIRLQKLNWQDAAFRGLIVRFGGEAALERIKSFDDESTAS